MGMKRHCYRTKLGKNGMGHAGCSVETCEKRRVYRLGNQENEPSETAVSSSRLVPSQSPKPQVNNDCNVELSTAQRQAE